MADSVNDEDSDLISLEKLSLTHASCFDCHCRCAQQKQLDNAVLPLSQNSNCVTLRWPPRQSGGVVKASKRKATALNVDAVTNCLVSRKKSNSLSSAAAAADAVGIIQDSSAWGQEEGAKADFGDLARLADVTIGPNERAADFASSTFRSFGRRTALDVSADRRRRRKNVSKQKADIVLADLKSVLLAENDDVPSTLRTASDSSQSGHHLSTMPCSQQALVNDCLMDELDELTGYFEHYFHIPKKMSEMAKMMYA